MGLLAVGSCKIGKKVKYFTPKGKNQDTVNIQNQSKTEVWQHEGQCLTSGTHGLLGSQGLSSSSSLALPSTAHRVSHRLRQAPLHSCRCCWSSRGTGISNVLVFPLELGCTFTKNLSSGTWLTPASLHNPFNPGASVTTEASPSPVASPRLSQCQASAAPMTLSCLQTDTAWEIYTLPSCCQCEVQPWPPQDYSLCV